MGDFSIASEFAAGTDKPRDFSVSKAELRDTTEHEREFRRIYAAITHRMVHRKSMLDMYHRQGLNIFCEYAPGETVILSAGCQRNACGIFFGVRLRYECSDICHLADPG